MSHAPHPLTLTAFVCMALLQVGVPLSMIARREATLKNGQPLKFKTAPVDPYDAFRGRYVALNVEQNTFTATNAPDFVRNQPVFAIIGEDDDGFAFITDVTPRRPRQGHYIKARVWYRSGDELRIRFPFDRYYMNEKLAPEAERAYRDHSRRSQHDAYIRVRVSGGFAVLEELYVADKPIREFMSGN